MSLSLSYSLIIISLFATFSSVSSFFTISSQTFELTLLTLTDIHTPSNSHINYSTNMLNMLSAAAILAFLGLASALPQKPGAQIPAKRAVPDNIAAIMSVDPSTFTSYQTGGLIRSGAPGSISNSTIDKRCPTNANGDCCQTTSQYDVGENDGGGWGITLQNGANVWEGFYFYENSCDSTVLLSNSVSRVLTDSAFSLTSTPGSVLIPKYSSLSHGTFRAE